MVSAYTMVWTLRSRNKFKSQTTLAPRADDALRRSAGRCPARTDPQRADHSHLRGCAQYDLGIGTDDLENVVFGFESCKVNTLVAVCFLEYKDLRYISRYPMYRMWYSISIW